MQGRNLDLTGVQSYLKVHYVIIKLAYAFSYQEKNLRKNSDRRSIRNLRTVTSSQPHAKCQYPWVYSESSENGALDKRFMNVLGKRLAVPIVYS